MTGHADEDRGQAAVIGIVLLVGLVAVGGIGILLIGGQIQEDTKNRAEQARIEQAFLELGRDVNTVSRSDSSERVIDLDLPDSGDSAVREERTGRVWVNRTNFSTGTTDTLVNQSIGSIRYTSDNGPTFAYQAGAVFRQAGNRTRVISNPGFEYSLNKTGDNPTLTLPIVTTVGPDSIPNGKIRARKVDTKSPINDDIIVENDLVSVTVKSEWYVGWAAYFRALAEKSGSTESAVTVDHTRQTATLELIVPVTRPSIDAGIIGGSAAGGTFEFANNIAVDSYDSDDGPYTSGSGNAKVVVDGNLTLKNNQEIDGDVVVGGELSFSNNNAKVTGNASYGTVDPDPPGSRVGGWAAANATVLEYEPVDSLIDARTAQVRSSNNNSAAPFSGDTLSGCGSPCTLYQGNYYLEELNIGTGGGPDTLELRPQGGEINIVVNGTVTVDGGDIDVEGPSGRVNVWVNSEQSGTYDIFMRQHEVTIPGDVAGRLWWYADKDGTGQLRGGSAEWRGVLFGPGSSGSPGFDLWIRNSGEYYGGFVGQVDDIDNKANIHFDEALTETETITATSTVPKLTFLVVTSYVVEVDDD